MILLYLLISYISRCYFRRREVLTAVIKKKKKSPECGAITSNLPVLDQLQQLQFYDPQIDVVFVSHLHSLPFYVLTFTSDSSLMMFIKCLRVRNWPEMDRVHTVEPTEHSRWETVNQSRWEKKNICIFFFSVEVLIFLNISTLKYCNISVSPHCINILPLLLLLLTVKYSKPHSDWLSSSCFSSCLNDSISADWLRDQLTNAFRILLSV